MGFFFSAVPVAQMGTDFETKYLILITIYFAMAIIFFGYESLLFAFHILARA
jgi:hypothetical protein